MTKENMFMRCTELLQRIDLLYPDYLKVWEEVCNIESPTSCKAGVDAACEYLSQLARTLGFSVEVLPQEKAGNAVCITMNPDAKASPICLSGHMDTVHPIGLFGTPAVRLDETKIYGPGVTDCKGGVVAALLAMDALRQCGFRSRPVHLLLQTDEEVGSSLSGRQTINYICEKSRGAVAFLNLEGHTSGSACIERKGIVTFTFTVTGKEAHSSMCAKLGANAILDAAYKIIEMEKLKDHDGLTCCCSVIRGGSVPNTVPMFCEFKANVRFLTKEQLAWVREYAQKVADTVHVPGCTCTVTQPRGRVAMELCERNVELLQKMNRIYEENGLPRLVPKTHTGGSDAADVTVYGTPCVDSLGTEGGRIHSAEEFSYLISLAESAKRIGSVVWSIED